MRVRPEGYETSREYRSRKTREVRAAIQRNGDWGFAVLEALGRALHAAGDPGAQPVELMRPHVVRAKGYRVVGVTAGWPINVFTPDPADTEAETRTRRITLLADGRWAKGGWDRDERCLRVLRQDVRPIGDPWTGALFDETLVSSVEALELAHGFRITFPIV